MPKDEDTTLAAFFTSSARLGDCKTSKAVFSL